jgi:kynurenine formamidase
MATMSRWKNRPPGANWGEFGADDQVGRLNLLTAARRLRAVQEVRDGVAFVLSLPLDYPGGVGLTPGRQPPSIVATRRASGETSYNFAFSRMNPLFNDVVSDDAVLLYTQYSTQWDALGHWGQEFDADGDGFPEIVYYNGFRGGVDIVGPGEEGGPVAHRLNVDAFAATGVQGRGVLVDLVTDFDRSRRSVGYDELMRILEAQQVRVEPGDLLCIYTGFADMLLEMQKKPDLAVLRNACAVLDGRDQRLLEWISNSGIAAICADNVGVEAVSYSPDPALTHKHSMMPLHEHCLFKLGIVLGEMWHFGDIARHLRGQRRSAFLLTAPPLRLTGCVGSPLTAVGTV